MIFPFFKIVAGGLLGFSNSLNVIGWQSLEVPDASP